MLCQASVHSWDDEVLREGMAKNECDRISKMTRGFLIRDGCRCSLGLVWRNEGRPDGKCVLRTHGRGDVVYKGEMEKEKRAPWPSVQAKTLFHAPGPDCCFGPVALLLPSGPFCTGFHSFLFL